MSYTNKYLSDGDSKTSFLKQIMEIFLPDNKHSECTRLQNGSRLSQEDKELLSKRMLKIALGWNSSIIFCLTDKIKG